MAIFIWLTTFALINRPYRLLRGLYNINYKYFLLVIAVVFLGFYPLLHPGLPPTHDGEYHLIRFYQFDKVLREGNWYPRWAPDLNSGFGVPLFNFVYPLPNYIASLLHFFGFSFISAFKLNMFFAGLVGGIFFYLWAKRFWGDLGGLIGATFYTFSPYHFLDVYIRGSVGEVWALALFPAFLWAIDKKRITCAILFLAGIIFSHNILALIFFPFSFAYAILISKQKKFLKIFVLGLGLAAIFWLPAIAEKKFSQGLEIFNYQDHFPQLANLLIPSWGSGFSGINITNQMSFQIGVANLLAVFLSFLLLKRANLFFLAWFWLLFFLMLPISRPIWKLIPLMNYLQFPWRLLSLVILCASFLAGSLVRLFKLKIFSLLLIILAIVLSFKYSKPAYYHDRNDEYYLNNPIFLAGTNSIANAFNTKWGVLKKGRKINKIEFVKGKAEIKADLIKSTNYKFTIQAEGQENLLLVNTMYFPGWSATIDKKPAEILINQDGTMSITLPQGLHQLNIRFKDTSIRLLAKVISLASLFFLLLPKLFFGKIKPLRDGVTVAR